MAKFSLTDWNDINTNQELQSLIVFHIGERRIGRIISFEKKEVSYFDIYIYKTKNGYGYVVSIYDRVYEVTYDKHTKKRLYMELEWTISDLKNITGKVLEQVTKWRKKCTETSLISNI